ncbi:MAG: hypothetical protein K2O52_04965, partial [Oscillospiraceae bacterium]|nr:hypothetical protein [Oscillospiraceae bacterium]
STLREDLKRIPYEFISQFGSIQLLNIAEGLYHVLKYVKSEFLVKVLRLNPEQEFNVCTLPKELICEFIDTGYKKMDEADFDACGFYPFQFHINMHKAQKLLPLLKEFSVHLTDNWWSNPLRKDVPEQICTFGRNSSQICWAVESVVDYHEDEKKRWILSLNDKGKKLLEWFLENKS